MAELDDLREALDAPSDASVVSSIRQPAALRRALAVAVSMGWAGSGNDGMNVALRASLEAFAQRAALDAHYEAHPRARPDLADVAQALAELDHDPLAREPELLRLAAREVREVRPEADADDVLLWATSLQQHAGRSGAFGRRRGTTAVPA